MRKNPKLNGLVCTAFDKVYRAIELSERQRSPELFAHVEQLVDSGHTDIEAIANYAMGMLRGLPAPATPERPLRRFGLAWLRPLRIRAAHAAPSP